MNERLKEIRNTTGLSQAKFGAELGASRDSINNYEIGRVVPSDTFVQLLCSKFNINEDWLRNGIGEMMLSTPQTIIEELKKEYSLDSLDTAIVESYLALDKEQRKVVKQYILDLSKRIQGEDKPQRRELFSHQSPQYAAYGQEVTSVDDE